MFRHQLGALALIAAFAFPLAASAQNAPAPGAPAAPAAQSHHHRHHRHHHNRYMHAMRGLNLSDAQRQQIAGIVKGVRSQNEGADRQTRRANMKALRAQIEGVLTSDQRNQLHANLAESRRTKPNGPPSQVQPQ